jgi:hypothetical protein
MAHVSIRQARLLDAESGHVGGRVQHRLIRPLGRFAEGTVAVEAVRKLAPLTGQGAADLTGRDLLPALAPGYQWGHPSPRPAIGTWLKMA